MKPLNLLAGVLLLSVLAAPALGRGIVIEGTEFQVNGPIRGRVTDPAVAVGPNGEYLVVWEVQRVGLFGRYFAGNRKAGARDSLASVGMARAGDLPLVANGQLPTNPGQGDYTSRHNPEVLFHPSGDFFLFWTEEDSFLRLSVFMEQVEVKDRDVWGQRFDRFGQPVSHRFRVNAGRAGLQSRPKARLLDDDTLAVVWESAAGGTEGTGPTGVFARLFDASGDPLGGDFQVNEGTVSNIPRPALAADGEGSFLVVWTGLDSDRTGVFARLYDRFGVAVSGEFRVNERARLTQQSPAVVAGQGGFLVAWQDQVRRFDYRIVGRLVDRLGRSEGSSFQISPSAFQGDGAPGLGLTPSGNFVAAWINWDMNFPRAVAVVELGPTGSPVGPAFVLSRSKVLAQWQLGFAHNAAGDLVATWTAFPTRDRGIVAVRLRTD